MALLTWLAGTRLGRAVSAAVAAVLALLGVYAAGRRDGRQKADARHVRRRVEAMREAQEQEDRTNAMGDNARRRELGRWMRDRDADL